MRCSFSWNSNNKEQSTAFPRLLNLIENCLSHKDKWHLLFCVCVWHVTVTMYLKNNLQLHCAANPKVQCGRHRSAADLEKKNENIFLRRLEKHKGERTLKPVSPRLTEMSLIYGPLIWWKSSHCLMIHWFACLTYQTKNKLQTSQR